MPTPLHVVHVITGLGLGGAESMLHRLVIAGRRADPEIMQQVISLGDLGPVGRRLADDGFDVEALTLRRAPLAGLSRLVARLRALPRPALVQTWMYHADVVGGVAARLAGLPVIWNVRQSGLDAADIGPATRRVVRVAGLLSGRLPRAIVCNAEAARAPHAALGWHASRFEVIPNGFDTDRFRPDAAARAAWRARLGVADGTPLVGNVARLDPQKDHATFVAMAAALRRRRPNARFVVAGSGVPGDAVLGALLRRHGFDDSTFLRLDAQSDVPGLMNALDVFCLSSRREGFPNVLGEAMACAVPSVSTDAGDARHVLGDDACVAPVGDAAALAARVERLLMLAPPERAALGGRQRERVVACYGIDAVWRQYRDLYRRLLDGTPSRPDPPRSPRSTRPASQPCAASPES